MPLIVFLNLDQCYVLLHLGHLNVVSRRYCWKGTSLSFIDVIKTVPYHGGLYMGNADVRQKHFFLFNQVAVFRFMPSTYHIGSFTVIFSTRVELTRVDPKIRVELTQRRSG